MERAKWGSLSQYNVTRLYCAVLLLCRFLTNDGPLGNGGCHALASHPPESLIASRYKFECPSKTTCSSGFKSPHSTCTYPKVQMLRSDCAAFHQGFWVQMM